MRIRTWLALITISFMPVTLYAQAGNDALLEELYTKSGLQKQLEQVPLVLQATLEQASHKDTTLRKLPKNIDWTIRTLAQKAFAPAALRETILREFREKLPVEDIKPVLTWLDSPLGKRCTQLEEAASTPQAQAEIQQYAVELQSSPPSKDRVEIFREFDSATKATESGVEMAVNSQIAVTLALMAVLPSEQQKSLDDITREAEKHKPKVEAAVRSHLLVSFLYTYRDLADAEIRQYIDFAKSAAGSHYQSVGTAALKKALIGASIQWGKSIGEAITDLKDQTDT